MRVVDVVGSGDPALGGDGYKTSYLINSMMIHPQNEKKTNKHILLDT